MEPIDLDGGNEGADDTDIPLSYIVHASVGLEVMDPGPSKYCAALDLIIEEEDGSLHAGGIEENIWGYQDNGQEWPTGSSK